MLRSLRCESIGAVSESDTSTLELTAVLYKLPNPTLAGISISDFSKNLRITCD